MKKEIKIGDVVKFREDCQWRSKIIGILKDLKGEDVFVGEDIDGTSYIRTGREEEIYPIYDEMTVEQICKELGRTIKIVE